jgi:hypothetical protein
MRGDRRRVAAATAVTASVAVVGLVSGCATIPGTSDPEVVTSYASAPFQENVPSPKPGRAPDLLLRDFFTAAAHPGGNHQAARAFLTRTADDGWKDSTGTVILDRMDLNADGAVRGDRISYTVRGTIVGRLGSGGVYVPDSRDFEDTLELTRVDGEWRISRLPEGVVLDRTDFTATHTARNIYFLDPTRRFLVPDRRWIYNRQGNIAGALVSLLAGGPREGLDKGVVNAIPPSDQVRTSGGPDGEFTADLAGLADISREDRKALAAQIVWTLASSDVRGPYRILADGAPIRDGDEPDWRLSDVNEFNPAPGTNGPLTALRDGSLVTVEDGTAQPTAGWTSQGSFESADVSVSDGVVAAVTGAGGADRHLQVGRPEENPVTVDNAETFTRPSWTGDSQVLYSVADGDRIRRFTRGTPGGAMPGTDVDSSSLKDIGIQDPRISVFSVSRDGTRAAMIINAEVYVSTLESEAEGDGPDRLRLGTPVRVGEELGPTVSVGWRPDGSLLVGTRSFDGPVWTVSVDGSEATRLSARNVTPPVVAVVDTGEVNYILDDRAVLQLEDSDATNPEDAIWREVPALQGDRAFPILGGK